MPQTSEPQSPGSDSSVTEVIDAPPIGACANAVADGSMPLVDDFEDGDQASLRQDGRDGSWYFYDDGTAGALQVNFAADPSSQRSGTVLSVEGEGFSDWGSGFGVGFNWNAGQCTYDASVYQGVQFWIRGAGQTRVTLQNLSVRPTSLGGECPAEATCFDGHGVSISVPEEWTLLRLPFTEFTQAGWGTPAGALRPEAVYLLEFQFAAAATFSIVLDDISFFRDEPAWDGGVSAESNSIAHADASASTFETDVGSPDAAIGSDAGVWQDASVLPLDAGR